VRLRSSPLEKDIAEEWEAYGLPSGGVGGWGARITLLERDCT